MNSIVNCPLAIWVDGVFFQWFELLMDSMMFANLIGNFAQIVSFE